MSSLKPCPFCGGEAQTDVGKAGQAAAFCDLFRSYCMDCGTQSPEWSYTEAEAITAWNTRAPIPVTDEMVERAARIISPGHWQVMDSYLAEMKRKYRWQNIAYDPDQFKDSASMHIARAALTAALGGVNG